MGWTATQLKTSRLRETSSSSVNATFERCFFEVSAADTRGIRDGVFATAALRLSFVGPSDSLIKERHQKRNITSKYVIRENRSNMHRMMNRNPGLQDEERKEGSSICVPANLFEYMEAVCFPPVRSSSRMTGPCVAALQHSASSTRTNHTQYLTPAAFGIREERSSRQILCRRAEQRNSNKPIELLPRQAWPPGSSVR